MRIVLIIALGQSSLGFIKYFLIQCNARYRVSQKVPWRSVVEWECEGVGFLAPEPFWGTYQNSDNTVCKQLILCEEWCVHFSTILMKIIILYSGLLVWKLAKHQFAVSIRTLGRNHGAFSKPGNELGLSCRKEETTWGLWAARGFERGILEPGEQCGEVRRTWIILETSRNGMKVSSRLNTPRFSPAAWCPQVFNHSFFIFLEPNGQWVKVF